MSFRNIFIGCVACLFAIASCKAPKQIQTAIQKVDSAAVTPVTAPEVDSAAIKKAIYDRVHSNKIDFNYFLGKIKIDFNDSKGKNTNATAFIRIKKDSLMWISITGALGIEGFRILVRPDSVWVMDKLEKTIAARSVEYLKEIVKLPVDFTVLQDLIIGNPVFFPQNVNSFKTTGNTLMALSTGEYFKHLITVDTSNNSILHSKLDDVDQLRNRTCGISLSGYAQVQNRLFSNMREITVTEKSKLDVLLEFKQVTFDEVQTFPFTIPKNYTSK